MAETANPPAKTGVHGYMESLRRSRIYPDNPYKHQYALVDTDDSEIAVTFQKIVEKHILMSNIKDATLLRLYQNDVILLCQMLDMARREPELEAFFTKTYFGWRGELMMTRTFNGLERKMQSTPSGYQPRAEMPGYGMDVNDPDYQEETNFFKNVFKGANNRLRQQQGQQNEG